LGLLVVATDLDGTAWTWSPTATTACPWWLRRARPS